MLDASHRPAPEGAIACTNPPVLVTGAPRSGSTWVGNILSLDPGSGYIHEPFNRQCPDGRCRARFDHAFTYVTGHNEAAYLDAMTDTLAWKYSPWAELKNIRNPRPARRKVRAPRALARMARDFSYFEMMRRRDARVILKDPLAVFSANWIASRFGARAVVVIRHPAAFIASLRAANWHRVRFEFFLNQPRLMEERLSPFRDAITAAVEERPDAIASGALLWNIIHHHIGLLRQEHPDWVFVRHEDLSRDPVKGFHDLFDRLGLDFTDAVRDDLKRYTSDSPTLARRSAFGTARRTMRNSRDSIFMFRKRLTPEEIAQVRDLTHPLWTRFYGPDDW